MYTHTHTNTHTYTDIEYIIYSHPPFALPFCTHPTFHPPSLPPPEQVRSSGSCVLIHCMAGISRSVTLVIAYLMQYYGLPMQQAYQFVKDKRPAISPNLNFMGQLVEFDRTIKENKLTQFLDISAYRPTAEQEKLSENMRAKSSESSSTETTPEPIRCNEPIPQPAIQFVLKPLVPKARHKKTTPIQGVGESKSVPAVSPKVEDKTNPIALLQPCSVSAHTRSGPELVEFSAPPLSIGSVTDPTPGVVRSSQDLRELLPVSLEGTQRSFVRLSLGEMSALD